MKEDEKDDFGEFNDTPPRDHGDTTTQDTQVQVQPTDKSHQTEDDFDADFGDFQDTHDNHEADAKDKTPHDPFSAFDTAPDAEAVDTFSNV